MALKLSDGVENLNDRLAFCQSGSTPAFTPEQLEKAIKNAVQEYSKHKRVNLLVDFNLIQNEETYDWPEEAASMEPFLFSNSTQSEIDYSGIPPAPVGYQTEFTHYFESPALVVRSETYIAKLKQNTLGRVEIDEINRKFTVYPRPIEAKTVKLLIFKAHELTGEGENETYETVLGKDVDRILDYAEAKLLRRLIKAYAVNEKKVGDRDYRGTKTAKELREEAEHLEENFRACVYYPAASRS
jgi:hypothetical protein